MQGHFSYSPLQPLQERKDYGNVTSDFNVKIKAEKSFQYKELGRDPSPQMERSPLKNENLVTKNKSKKMWEYDWTLLVP